MFGEFFNRSNDELTIARGEVCLTVADNSRSADNAGEGLALYILSRRSVSPCLISWRCITKFLRDSLHAATKHTAADESHGTAEQRVLDILRRGRVLVRSKLLDRTLYKLLACLFEP